MSSPVASTADVATLDAILHALYEIISGPADQPRDWDRFRSPFLPGGRLMPFVSLPEGTPYVRLLSPEDYIRRGKQSVPSMRHRIEGEVRE